MRLVQWFMVQTGDGAEPVISRSTHTIGCLTGRGGSASELTASEMDACAESLAKLSIPARGRPCESADVTPCRPGDVSSSIKQENMLTIMSHFAKPLRKQAVAACRHQGRNEGKTTLKIVSVGNPHRLFPIAAPLLHGRQCGFVNARKWQWHACKSEKPRQSC